MRWNVKIYLCIFLVTSLYKFPSIVFLCQSHFIFYLYYFKYCNRLFYSHLPFSSWPWWRLLLSSRNIGQINNPSRAVWSALPSILRTTQWIGMSWLCWAIFQHFFEFGELFLHFQHPCALSWLLSRIWNVFAFWGTFKHFILQFSTGLMKYFVFETWRCFRNYADLGLFQTSCYSRAKLARL